jgi:hypothetical protein
MLPKKKTKKKPPTKMGNKEKQMENHGGHPQIVTKNLPLAFGRKGKKRMTMGEKKGLIKGRKE